MNDALKETRETTVGELMDMIAELNAAFAEKIGKEPEVGFEVEINSYHPEQLSIYGGYEKLDAGFGAVLHSYDGRHDTPKEAFHYVMQKINEYKLNTKADKIKALREQIAELEKE